MSLDLSQNHLSRVRGLQRCPNLKELDLEGNVFSHIDDSVCSLAKLESLQMSYNSLNELNPKLGSMDTLARLDLEGNALQ